MRALIGNCVVIGALLGTVPAFPLIAAPLENAGQKSAPDARLREGIKLLSAGDASGAAEILSQLIENSPPGLDQKAASIAAGKAYLALEDYPHALKCFESALTHASETAEVIVLRLAAADAALRCQHPDVAITYCHEVLKAEPTAKQRQMALRTCLRAQLSQGAHSEALDLLERETAEQKDDADPDRTLADYAIRIGTTCLKEKDVETAIRSYRWYLSNVDNGPSLQVAELGMAWAAAMGAESPEQAAKRMRAFLERFPTSPDRAAVLQAEAACWRQAGEHDRAEEPLRKLIAEEPDSAAAFRALDQLSAEAHDDQSETTVEARRTAVAASGSRLAPTANILSAAIRDAAVEKDEDHWQLAIDKALMHASAGEIITDALVRLTRKQEDAYAERLAVQLLTRLEDPAVVSATEAVTEWIANSGRWSMLALACEKVDPEERIPQLGATTSRLIAESFMQTGRAGHAKKWFDGAVEHHGLSDFASLLRRAELAVALDPLPVAEQRLTAAQAAAKTEADRAVVEILVAEQLIRKNELDESRAILQRLVRMDGASSEVRCRAQWLIGETFLMQQRYPEAIDAYRRVEVLNASERWAAAALVQAGKAFEKMGRTREASVCYSGLLQRFADSEHAAVARDRLATMRETTTLR